ncbi:MAG: hypothetical protein AAFW70_23350 [Cyanobacteria bacterium J06635_10]
MQKISSARVIHFATHGLLDGKDFGELTPGALAFAPSEGRLALAPDTPKELLLFLTLG